MKNKLFILFMTVTLLLTGCAPVADDVETKTVDEVIEVVTEQATKEIKEVIPDKITTKEQIDNSLDEASNILDQIANGLVDAAEEVIKESTGGGISGTDKKTTSEKTSTYQVSRIVDGDTIVVTNNGIEEKVRLLMIDTPEVHNVDTPEPFGPEASKFTKELLEGKTVTLEFDKEKYDRYDRTLAYVYLEDGRMVNELLLAEGLASVVVYKPNNKYENQFRKIEEQAKAANKGIWSN